MDRKEISMEEWRIVDPGVFDKTIIQLELAINEMIITKSAPRAPLKQIYHWVGAVGLTFHPH